MLCLQFLEGHQGMAGMRLKQIALRVSRVHFYRAPGRTVAAEGEAGGAFVGLGLISYWKRIESIAGLRLLYSTASVARAWAAVRVLFINAYCPCNFWSSRKVKK